MFKEEIRSAVLAFNDLKIVPVPTPEWPTVDGEIFVRSLSAGEREQYLDAIRDPDAPESGRTKNAGITLVAMTACTKDREPIFTLEDVIALREKNGACIDRIQNTTGPLNGFGKKKEEETKNDYASVRT